MVMASWPESRRRGTRAPISDAVRRRVDHAVRMGLRRALRVGGLLLAAALVGEAVRMLALHGDPAAVPAAVTLLAGLAVLGLGQLGGRRSRGPELAILAALTAAYGAATAAMTLLPVVSSPGIGYLAILLVGSGAVLTWSTAWHATWLGLALSLSGVQLLVALGRDAAGDAVPLVAPVAAALVSLAIQPLGRARARRTLEQRLEIRALLTDLRRRELAVEELGRELGRTARLDTVTGIGNRRALDEALAGLTDRRLAAVLLDVDHFKAFNDRNGHLAGDAALARVGEILRASVRTGDLVFRYGGEEFLVLLPDHDRDGAARVAERVRESVQAETAAGLGLTVSAGVAVADRFSASSPLPLLRRADAALYQAKRAGRNRVVVDGLGDGSAGLRSAAG